MKISSTNWFRRYTLLTAESFLANLDHDRGSDRIRRIFYDRVSAIVVWRTLPWLRIITTLLLLCLPGVLMQLPREPVVGFFGMGAIALGGGLVVWWVVCRRTHVLICRDAARYHFSFTVSPRRAHKFLSELTHLIRKTQSLPVTRPGNEVNSSPPV